MVARSETDPVAWFRPVLVTKGGPPGGQPTFTTICGAPTRSETKARACAARIGRARSAVGARARPACRPSPAT